MAVNGAFRNDHQWPWLIDVPMSRYLHRYLQAHRYIDGVIVTNYLSCCSLFSPTPANSGFVCLSGSYSAGRTYQIGSRHTPGVPGRPNVTLWPRPRAHLGVRSPVRPRAGASHAVGPGQQASVAGGGSGQQVAVAGGGSGQQVAAPPGSRRPTAPHPADGRLLARSAWCLRVTRCGAFGCRPPSRPHRSARTSPPRAKPR